MRLLIIVQQTPTSIFAILGPNTSNTVYFEPNISLSNFKAEVNNLIEKLDPFDKVIISGDFNAICSDFGDNMWD